MTIEANDEVIQENIRVILKFSREINLDFRDREWDSLWKAASAINVASGDIVRRIVKALP